MYTVEPCPNGSIAQSVPDGVREYSLAQGSLEAAVESFPQYPGNEAAYLRATIAIISTQAVLSPNGYAPTFAAANRTAQLVGGTGQCSGGTGQCSGVLLRSR